MDIKELTHDLSPDRQPADAARITMTVHTDLGALASMRQEWDDVVVRSGGDIYFTYGWCSTWWKHYGDGRHACVLLFRENGRLVALLPLMMDTLWVGLLRIRLAKLLGSDSTTVVLNPPVLAECAKEVYAQAVAHMLGPQQCDAIWWGPLAGDKAHRSNLEEACRSSETTVCNVHDLSPAVHTVFHLPDTYEAYLAGLSKDQRAMVRRERRTFEKQCQPTIDILTDAHEIETAFDEFLALHQAQWTTQNMLGHFGDMPAAGAFNRDLVRVFAQQGSIWLLRIQSAGRTIAFEYAFVFAGALYWRLPARQTGIEWERLSLGRVSLSYLIEAAIQRKIGWIEGGCGHYPYKRRMGAEEIPVCSMLLSASRRGSRIRARLFCGFSQLLHLFYYRIWFSRLAPKLPLPRRPLWRCWIRTRM